MMTSRRTVWGAAFLSLCLACFLTARAAFSDQSDAGPEPAVSSNEAAENGGANAPIDAAKKPPAAEAAPPAGPNATPKPPLDHGEFRDPTQPGPVLRDLLAPAPTAQRAAQPALPKITLKGRVIPLGKPGSAILEVDGQVRAIQDGKEATIASSAGLVTLRVSQLDVSEVRVDVLPLDQELVLH